VQPGGAGGIYQGGTFLIGLAQPVTPFCPRGCARPRLRRTAPQVGPQHYSPVSPVKGRGWAGLGYAGYRGVENPTAAGSRLLDPRLRRRRWTVTT